MTYLFLFLILVSFVFLAYRYIGYMQATRTAAGHASKRAVFYLFSGFVLLVSISNIFADALFELLGLEKPSSFELMSFLAYCVFAIAVVLIFRNRNQEPDALKNTPSPAPASPMIIQNHSGNGDNVAGDKINRQINMGPGSTYIENQHNQHNTPPPQDQPANTNEVRKLIAQGKLEKALDAFHPTQTEDENEILQLKARLQNLNRKTRLGTIGHENETIERNRISNALLQLLTN